MLGETTLRWKILYLTSCFASLAGLLAVTPLRAQEDPADSAEPAPEPPPDPTLRNRICSAASEEVDDHSSDVEEADEDTIYVVRTLRITNRLGRVVLVNCLPDAEVLWVEATPDVRKGGEAVRLPHYTTKYRGDPNEYRVLDFNRADPLRERIASDIEWRLQRDPQLPQTCNFRVTLMVQYGDGRASPIEDNLNPCIRELLALERPAHKAQESAEAAGGADSAAGGSL